MYTNDNAAKGKPRWRLFMKKVKILFGAVLAVILAFSCLAFAACGDGMFNGIDNEANAATDASLAAFMGGIAENSAIDTESGLPGFIGGNSYSIEYKVNSNVEMSGEGASVTSKTDMSVNGTVNLTKSVTAKLDMKTDVSVSMTGPISSSTKTSVATKMVAVDNKVYCDVSANDEQKKFYIDLDDMSDFIGDIEDFVPSDTETVKLEDFVNELKESLADNELFAGVTINPVVYIKEATMKITLGDAGYIGIAFDSEWNLSACDLVVKVSYKNPSMGTITGNTEIKLRKSGAVSVSAPSDASSYESGSIQDIIGGIGGSIS